jgi:hypothetical protein
MWKAPSGSDDQKEELRGEEERLKKKLIRWTLYTILNII